MNTNKYSKCPIATPTLVFGMDVSDLNATDCLTLIGRYNSEVKELEKVGVESAYLKAQIQSYKDAIAVLVARMDTFAPAAPAASAEPAA